MEKKFHSFLATVVLIISLSWILLEILLIVGADKVSDVIVQTEGIKAKFHRCRILHYKRILGCYDLIRSLGPRS